MNISPWVTTTILLLSILLDSTASPQRTLARPGSSMQGPANQEEVTYTQTTIRRREDEASWAKVHMDSGIHFSKVGQLIGSPNFGHLILDINITSLEEHLDILCSYAKLLYNFGDMSNTHLDLDKRTADTINTYVTSLNNRCQTVKTSYHDIRSIFLDYTQVNMDLRKRRQLTFAAALLISGVAAATSYLFSQSQVVAISSQAHRPDESTIRILQDHENRITLQEDLVKGLNDTLYNLVVRQAGAQELMESTRVYTMLESSASVVIDEIERVLSGLMSLSNHRLSPKLVKTEYLADQMNELKRSLQREDLTPMIRSLEDIYHCETSHIVFENGTLRILVHIPAFRDDTLLDLYRYIKVPIRLNGEPSKKHDSNEVQAWVPEAEGDLLAVSPSHSLFRTLREEEFSRCRNIGATSFCREANAYDRRVHESCIVSLFVNDPEKIFENCRWSPQQEQDYLAHLTATQFVLYQHEMGTVERRCGRNFSSVAFQGLRKIEAAPGCRIQSRTFIFDGGENVYLDPSEILLHYTNIGKELSKNMPTAAKLKAAYEDLQLSGHPRPVTIKQLRNVAWHNSRRAVVNSALSSLVILVGIIVILCICYCLCPIMHQHSAWCRSFIDLTSPCCAKYRVLFSPLAHNIGPAEPGNADFNRKIDHFEMGEYAAGGETTERLKHVKLRLGETDETEQPSSSKGPGIKPKTHHR